MNPGNDLSVFLSEYLPLTYFLLKILAVPMILLSFILVFACRYICAFRERMCSYVRTTGVHREYLPLIYFLLKNLAVPMILLLFILVFM
jgi:hypothetical protein